MNWLATSDQTWLTFSPTYGSSGTVVTVAVNTAGLTAGTYTGTITITDNYASNSPQTVAVTLNVYPAGGSAAPFSEYSTRLTAPPSAAVFLLPVGYLFG